MGVGLGMDAAAATRHPPCCTFRLLASPSCCLVPPWRLDRRLNSRIAGSDRWPGYPDWRLAPDDPVPQSLADCHQARDPALGSHWYPHQGVRQGQWPASARIIDLAGLRGSIRLHRPRSRSNGSAHPMEERRGSRPIHRQQQPHHSSAWTIDLPPSCRLCERDDSRTHTKHHPMQLSSLITI